MLFVPLDMLFIMKTLEDKCYVVIKAYKFTVLEILVILYIYIQKSAYIVVIFNYRPSPRILDRKVK